MPRRFGGNRGAWRPSPRRASRFERPNSARSRVHGGTTALRVPRSFLQQCRAVLVAVAVLGLVTRSAAQDTEERAPGLDRVRVEYRAPSECPDVEAFKRLVSSRVSETWEAAPGELARRFVVEVTSLEGTYAATAEVADERGERAVKTVSGAECAHVVDGIALVTALAIQSRGGNDEPPASDAADAPAAEPPSPAPGSAASAARTPSPVAAPASAAAGDGAQARAFRAQPPSGHARGSPFSAGLRVSARAALATGVGPSPAAGAELGIVLEPGGARLGVVLQAFRSGRTEAHGITARFELLSARVEGCPLALVLTDWASLEPCPFAALGVMTGQAFEDPPAAIRGERGSAPWYAAGGFGRAVGRFGSLIVEVEALLGAPLRRERFYVERGGETYQVPTIYGAVAVGLGVRF
jgi:hypothetical protein